MPSNIQPIFKFSQLFQNVIQFLLIRKVFNWNMICTHFYMCKCKAWWIIQKWILLCEPVLFSRSRDSVKFQSFQGLFSHFSPLFSRIFFLPLFFFFQKLNLWGDKSNWLLQSSFPPHLLSSSSFPSPSPPFPSPSPLSFSPIPPFSSFFAMENFKYTPNLREIQSPHPILIAWLGMFKLTSSTPLTLSLLPYRCVTFI